MGPLIGGALISGATSLLGGLFGRNSEKKAIAEQNEYNNPTNIRKRAEEAGFNPLSFIGPGVGLQTATGGSNYMGSAIADAGMAFADAMAKKAELGKLDELQQANAKLAAKVQSLTLRPKVGGVYAQRQSTPTIAAAVGGGNGKVSGAGTASSVSNGGADADQRGAGGVSGGFPPLAETSSLDPRRDVDIAGIPSDPGFILVDNPHLGGAFPVPALQGEPLDLGQLIVAGGSLAAARSLDLGYWLRNKTDAMGWTTDGVNYRPGAGRVSSPRPKPMPLSHRLKAKLGNEWWLEDFRP